MRGYSLIEAMVAVVILAVGVDILFLNSFVPYERSAQIQIRQERLVAMLDNKMERFRTCRHRACLEALARSESMTSTQTLALKGFRIRTKLSRGPSHTIRVQVEAEATDLQPQTLEALMWVSQ